MAFVATRDAPDCIRAIRAKALHHHYRRVKISALIHSIEVDSMQRGVVSTDQVIDDNLRTASEGQLGEPTEFGQNRTLSILYALT